MSAEIFVKFKSSDLYVKNKTKYYQYCLHLPTFVKNEDNVVELKSNDSVYNAWSYDCRVVFCSEYILIDVAAASPKVYEDIKGLIGFLKLDGMISVEDDDGENEEGMFGVPG